MFMDAREASLKALIEISYNKDFDKVFSDYVQKTEYRADFGQLVNGVIKNISYLDFFIEQISQRKPKFLQNDVRNILRLAFFELEFTQTPDYAIVNSYVEMTKIHNNKAVSFVNALLRNFIRKRDKIILPKNQLDSLSIKYSHPKWMIKRWILHFGKDEIENILQFNNSSYGLWVRVNTLRISVNAYLSLLVENEIEYEQNEFLPECIKVKYKGNIEKLTGYKEGYFIVQGLASSLVANVLEPDVNQKVLDICAAPGGKTTHIAAMMNNTGSIIAVDSNRHRLEKLEQNVDRLDIKNVTIMTKDATKLDFNKKFDRILIDAPCSNTGVFCKRPDAKWKKSIEDIEELAKVQYKILANCSRYLNVGGTLVYSTCSIEPEENMLVVHKFLQNHKNFELKPFNVPCETEGTLQLVPSEFGMEGFFIAKLTKKSEGDLIF